MTVELDEQGTVTAGGRPVDWATAYHWAVDSPETITDLVHDTRAFVTVLAEAEHADPEEQAAAVPRAFAAGRPRRPGATWADGQPQGPGPNAVEAPGDERVPDGARGAGTPDGAGTAAGRPAGAPVPGAGTPADDDGAPAGTAAPGRTAEQADAERP
ncbi:hypothetical protein LQU92_04575 [Kocuria sp. LUK]|uniref:hypothetical protein n=1 Tax=Kocuria sp. LUK TaxID=2897828 RepID=UPI001E3118B4|nr:hypothetical protein [Kocuria sp. LUK]MCD1144519.1 hypothetical protein [Kocuria sp. LUK]